MQISPLLFKLPATKQTNKTHHHVTALGAIIHEKLVICTNQCDSSSQSCFIVVVVDYSPEPLQLND